MMQFFTSVFVRTSSLLLALYSTSMMRVFRVTADKSTTNQIEFNQFNFQTFIDNCWLLIFIITKKFLNSNINTNSASNIFTLHLTKRINFCVMVFWYHFDRTHHLVNCHFSISDTEWFLFTRWCHFILHMMKMKQKLTDASGTKMVLLCAQIVEITQLF